MNSFFPSATDLPTDSPEPTSDTSESDSQSTTMCDTPGESDCLTTQTTVALSDTRFLTIALVAGILGGIGTAILVILVVLCVLIVTYRKKTTHIVTGSNNAHEQNQPQSGSHTQDGLSTMMSENAYDYIEPLSSNSVQQTATGRNVAYNARTDAVIVIQSNEAYDHRHQENGNAIYETIADQVGDSSTREPNHAYHAHSIAIVVSPNNAYGVSHACEEEEPYYI